MQQDTVCFVRIDYNPWPYFKMEASEAGGAA